MKYLITILLFFQISSCQLKNNKLNDDNSNKIDYLFKAKFEHSLISRGDNFPDFRFSKDSMDLFLITLHEKIPISEFKKKTNFSNEKTKHIEKFLETKNWLHFV